MNNQKKNTGLYVLIVILSVLVLALGGYIVYDKVLSKPIDSEVKQTDDEEKTATNESVSKLDDTKDWVYDAEYTKNVTVDSYSLYGKTYYAKDIVVPFINVNSSYANNANSEIKSVFDNAIKVYNEGATGNVGYVDKCNYEKYVNDNTLSVVLAYGAGGYDMVYPKYYTYNIDLKTGNKLSYEEIYTTAGISSSDIDSRVENAVTKVMHDKLKDLEDRVDENGNYGDGTSFNTYNNRSISNYKKAVSDNTLKYFLSDDKKLNVIVTLNIPAGQGQFDTIITVE